MSGRETPARPGQGQGRKAGVNFAKPSFAPDLSRAKSWTLHSVANAKRSAVTYGQETCQCHEHNKTNAIEIHPSTENDNVVKSPDRFKEPHDRLWKVNHGLFSVDPYLIAR
jgi:hypothetical protein